MPPRGPSLLQRDPVVAAAGISKSRTRNFGPQTDNVYVERYVPQSVLLPHCDIVVNHGGSGSVIGALAHGLPLVVLPMGADQLPNAQRCERLGVGVVLDAVRVTPRSVRDTTSALLRDAQAREAAERIRDEGRIAPRTRSSGAVARATRRTQPHIPAKLRTFVRCRASLTLR